MSIIKLNIHKISNNKYGILLNNKIYKYYFNNIEILDCNASNFNIKLINIPSIELINSGDINNIYSSEIIPGYTPTLYDNEYIPITFLNNYKYTDYPIYIELNIDCVCKPSLYLYKKVDNNRLLNYIKTKLQSNIRYCKIINKMRRDIGARKIQSFARYILYNPDNGIIFLKKKDQYDIHPLLGIK